MIRLGIILVLTIGLQIVLTDLGLYMTTDGFKNWMPANNVMRAAQMAAIMIPQIISILFINYIVGYIYWRKPLNLEAGDFLELVSIETPLRIEWYITKNGIYHYFTDYEKIRWATKYKEPLEFPVNCKLVEMSRK